MQLIHDYNCQNCGPDKGGRGVTYWGPANTQAIAPGGTVNWTFTGTQPRCYQDTIDNCNVSFNLFTEANATSYDYVGPVKIKLNGTDIGTDNYHSKIQGHDLSIAVDLAPNAQYDDNGPNTISIVNNDSQVTVDIALLQIARVYYMCWLPCDVSGYCDNSGRCSGANPDCQAYSYTGYAGLDSTRVDHPCNLSYGGYSYSYFKDTASPYTINPGSSQTWTWTNPSIPAGCSNNYVGPSRCLFNFNQCSLDTNAGGSDAPFNLSINGTAVYTGYLSKVAGKNAFPFIDLCQYQAQYNDSPGASNTLTLYNNATTAKIITDADAMDMYRIYRTSYL